MVPLFRAFLDLLEEAKANKLLEECSEELFRDSRCFQPEIHGVTSEVRKLANIVGDDVAHSVSYHKVE